MGRWISRIGTHRSELGLSSRDAVLVVGGRASGRPRSIPVVVASVDGQRYLVSILGPDSDWVKNLEAAHGEVILRQSGRRPIRLVPAPPEDRARVLRQYVRVASNGGHHFPVAVGASFSEFEAIAEHHPAFRIDPR